MPTHEIITVQRGDFDKKYVRVNHDGAQNRVMNPKKLRSIAKNWVDASKDTVTLIRLGDEYLIADGQHRIAAASTLLSKPATLHAMVWDAEEIEDFADFITAFNRGTAFSVAHMLQVYQEQSNWPVIAGEYDVKVRYRRYHGDAYSWMAILRGVGFADYWREAERIGSKTLRKEALVQEYWLAYSDQGIEEVMEALQWWAPLAKAAIAHPMKVGQMYSDVAIAIAISLFRKYRNKPATLKIMRERFLASNKLTEIKTLNPNNTRWMVNAILGGMNFRVQHKNVDLYGETGRE